MDTPAQLCDRLRDLGIDRNERNLTDWRKKGLLPALLSESAGRGCGVKRFWKEDVLEQAIAADWLMTQSDRADEARFGLWLSGYKVDPALAQQAWIQHLNRIQRQRTQAASRLSGGYSSLWTAWWKKLQTNDASAVPLWGAYPKEDQTAIREFLGATQEWLRNEDERDNEDYRNHVSEMIVRLFRTNGSNTYRNVRRIWTLLDPSSTLAIGPSIEVIKSFSVPELKTAHISLALVARTIQHSLQISTALGDINRVVLPLKLMRDFIGSSLAKSLIMANRSGINLPLENSISALHSFVMCVQSTDIIHKTDGSLDLSGRIHSEWESTKEKLSDLWNAMP
jgi:hypothetical protein